ncbi:MAG: plasmid pRiA4b ORF-3 family protein [Deltaproteobacteria bacterium]|jgi:hypothetical protein|nr:plasmid pRiA4b ORF-3 family protein [Deltaproteobacteria bacterium]
MDSNYCLRISLVGSKPRIFRKIVVPGRIDLAELHLVIQEVMGWDNSHLHSFRIGDDTFSSSDFDRGYMDDDLPGEEYRLNEVVHFKKDVFKYLYDFGDDWLHKITVHDVDYQPKKKEVVELMSKQDVVCLSGEGACPPDDCGGIWQYNWLVENLSDPDCPKRAEYLENLFLNEDDDFDPHHFDLNEVNARLSFFEIAP